MRSVRGILTIGGVTPGRIHKGIGTVDADKIPGMPFFFHSGCPLNVSAPDPRTLQQVLDSLRITGTDGQAIQENALNVLILRAVRYIIGCADDIFICHFNLFIITCIFRQGIQVLGHLIFDHGADGSDLFRSNIEFQFNLPDSEGRKAAHACIPVNPEELRVIQDHGRQGFLDRFGPGRTKGEFGALLGNAGKQLCVNGLYR